MCFGRCPQSAVICSIFFGFVRKWCCAAGVRLADELDCVLLTGHVENWRRLLVIFTDQSTALPYIAIFDIYVIVFENRDEISTFFIFLRISVKNRY